MSFLYCMLHTEVFFFSLTNAYQCVSVNDDVGQSLKINMKLIFFQGQVEADIEALDFDRYAIYRPG